LFFDLFPFANIADDAAEEEALLRLPRAERHLERELGPVFAQSDELDRATDDVRFTGLMIAFHALFVRDFEALGHDERDRFPEHLACVISEQSLGPVVPLDDATFVVRDDDGIVRRLDDGLELRFEFDGLTLELLLIAKRNQHQHEQRRDTAADPEGEERAVHREAGQRLRRRERGQFGRAHTDIVHPRYSEPNQQRTDELSPMET